MTAADVCLPLPLVRQRPWYPGQIGVPGTDHELGLRTHPTGAVFYVDPNCPGASDQRDGTSPDDPLLTVAAALTKCQPFRGDTILVAANDNWPEGAGNSDYAMPVQEAVVVTVPGVRIVGAHQSSPVGVVWMPPAAGGPCISVYALDVLIEGFAFVGGAVGGIAIYAEWAGGFPPVPMWGDNLIVRHCYFNHDIDTGIQLEFIWAANIHDNVFEACGVYGIYVDTAGSGIDHCLIHDNVFLDVATCALNLEDADNCEIYRNRIYNTASATGGLASLNTMINLTGGFANLVHQNVLSCRLGAALGQYDDANSPGANDAWIQNLLMNGPNVLNPA